MRSLCRTELEARYQSLDEVNTVVLYYLVVGPVFYHEGEKTDCLDLNHDEVNKRLLDEMFVVSRSIG